MALHNVRDKDNYAHIHRVCGHMSKQSIQERSHSKNAQFSDIDVAKVRHIWKACAYGELRQTSTDQHRVHRPMSTKPSQCFSIDAFTCKHVSIRDYKYCVLMRDNASQMIYCNFAKYRTADKINRSLTDTWKLNPGWIILIQAGRRELKVHPHGPWEILSIWHCSLLRMRDGMQDQAMEVCAWQVCRRKQQRRTQPCSSTELLRPSGAEPCSRPLKTWISHIVWRSITYLITSSLAITTSLQSVTSSYHLRIATASFQHGVRTDVGSLPTRTPPYSYLLT